MARRTNHDICQLELKIQKLQFRDQIHKEKEIQFSESIKRLHERVDSINEQIKELSKDLKENTKKLYTLSGSFAIVWVIVQFIMKS